VFTNAIIGTTEELSAIMPNIFIINCQANHNLGCEYNKGGNAVMLTTIQLLRQEIPGAKFATFVQLSEEFAEAHSVKVFRNRVYISKSYSLGTIVKSWSTLARSAIWAISRRHFPPLAKLAINTRELRQYHDADVIIDASMDLFSDDFGSISVIEHAKDVLIGALLKKPVVIWAQSPGPFRSKLTSWFAKIALNQAALITVREEISLAHLRELGVGTPPVYVTADPAFLMEPSSDETASEILSKEGVKIGERPLIGVTMAWTVLITEAKSSIYLKFMKSIYRLAHMVLPEKLFEFVKKIASRLNRRLDMSGFVDITAVSEIVDHIVQKLDANVILIPHDITPGLDDRIIAAEILKTVKYPDKVWMLTGEYSPQQLKAVIGRCDLFVGGKMHANIAALSMQVPTVGLQYSHKFRGIMALLGQEEFICDKLVPDEVKSKIDLAWASREHIKADLRTRIDLVKNRALQNAELVADLLQPMEKDKVS
jgi:colanic acid/amylovoran biosynthesis protein